MPEYAAKFAEVLAQSRQPESPFTQQDAAALVKSAGAQDLGCRKSSGTEAILVRARDRFANIGNRIAGCTTFHTVELETIALCGVGQFDTQRLADAVNLRMSGDRAEPTALFDLLSDAPMPGIHDIRRIVESE
jgi:hypothetical protein